MKQKIIHSDCRKGVKNIKNKSVSLILTDPPYFIDGMSSNWNKSQIDKRKSKANVIGSLPIGMKFSNQQSKDLKKFMTPITQEWKRIMKPGGFVLCFMQPRLSHSLAGTLEEAGFYIKDLYVWKRTGQAKAFTHTHFIKKKEYLNQKQKEKIIRSIGGRKTPQLKPDAEMIIMAQSPQEGTLVNNWMKYKTGFINVENNLIEPNTFPNTIMPCSRQKNKYEHIASKPVLLLRHLLKIFCEPKGLVFDPFAGTGSCAEACFIENYKYIGFEIDSEYVNIAKKRILNLENSFRKRNSGSLQTGFDLSLQIS